MSAEREGHCSLTNCECAKEMFNSLRPTGCENWVQCVAPAPTGDVGELETEIAKILKDQYEAMTVTLRDGTRQYFAARAAKAVMERVNSRSMLPAKDVCVDREVLNHTLEAGKREIAALRKALKPFAEFDCEGWTGPMLKGFTHKGQETLLKMSHFEAARTALTGAGEEGGDRDEQIVRENAR